VTIKPRLKTMITRRLPRLYLHNTEFDILISVVQVIIYSYNLFLFYYKNEHSNYIKCDNVAKLGG